VLAGGGRVGVDHGAAQPRNGGQGLVLGVEGELVCVPDAHGGLEAEIGLGAQLVPRLRTFARLGVRDGVPVGC